MSPLKIAHRGDTKHWPENTLEGLKSALQFALDGVEFDVQLTADHQPVLFHDDDLERLLGVKGSIYDYTFKELSSFELAQKVHIPHLKQVFEEIKDTYFYLEVKIPTPFQTDFPYISNLCNAIKQVLPTYNGASTIASFHPMVLDHFSENCDWPLTAILEEEGLFGFDDFKNADFFSLDSKLPRFNPEKTMIWGGNAEQDKLELNSKLFAVISDHWIK